MNKITVLTVLAIAIGVAGCTRSTNALRVNTQPPPQPLPSSPSGVVETGQLQPTLPQEPQINQPVVPEAPQAPTIADVPSTQPGTEVAALETPEVSNKPITHETVTGAWNVNSDNPDCRIFLSFTQWSGGYRAGTRRCNTPALTSVSAWDVKGNQVVLVDSNGTQVASLGSTGAERYAGTLAGGQPITFSR